MLEWLKRNKKICFIIGGVLLPCIVLLCIFLIPKDGGEQTGGAPILTVETPQKLSLSGTDTFVLDVTISSFGEAIYPAASMSIAFDASRLEFLGIEEGNVFIKSDNSSGQICRRSLPH